MPAGWLAPKAKAAPRARQKAALLALPKPGLGRAVRLRAALVAKPAVVTRAPRGLAARLPSSRWNSRLVVGWLGQAEIPFAIIGGLAASLHGKPRVTKDVDVVAIAEQEDWSHLLDQATNWSLRPRIEDALEFAKTTRVLLLVHEPTRIEVELSFGMLPFETELVSRATSRNVKQVGVSIGQPGPWFRGACDRWEEDRWWPGALGPVSRIET